MKLATVFASLSAATLMLAQPAVAATHSAGAEVTGLDSRVGSRVGQSEDMMGGPTTIAYIGILAAALFLILVVVDDDSFDDIDELPASP